MSDDITAVAREHHAFYEVSPYYVFVEEKHGSPAARNQKVQAGFDVDVYGVNIKAGFEFPGPDPDYALSDAQLQEIAEDISRHAAGSCYLEVISFPETIVFDSRKKDMVEGMFKIRISHLRGLDQPAGEPEHQALDELVQRLRSLGVAGR